VQTLFCLFLKIVLVSVSIYKTRQCCTVVVYKASRSVSVFIILDQTVYKKPFEELQAVEDGLMAFKKGTTVLAATTLL